MQTALLKYDDDNDDYDANDDDQDDDDGEDTMVSINIIPPNFNVYVYFYSFFDISRKCIL